MLKKLILAILFISTSIFFYLFVVNPYRISGNCMEPAIKDGKLYFVNHLHYKFNSYKIGDIIIFQHEDKIWISRIIGLEKQEIKISEQTIFINHAAHPDVIERNWQNWRYGEYGVDDIAKIPTGHAYVLSDNLSAHHDDSRVFGPISYNNILGKVW